MATALTIKNDSDQAVGLYFILGAASVITTANLDFLTTVETSQKGWCTLAAG